MVAVVSLAILPPASTSCGQPASDLLGIRQELARVLAALEEQRAAIADLKDAVERLEQASKASQERRGRAETPRIVTVSTRCRAGGRGNPTVPGEIRWKTASRNSEDEVFSHSGRPEYLLMRLSASLG